MATFTDRITLRDVEEIFTPQQGLRWEGADTETISDDVSSGSDGFLDANLDTDYYIDDFTLFTGFTFEVGGENYAIFSDGADWFIPYNSADGEILDSLTPPDGGTLSTTTFSARTDQIVNCFASGTTIATPDGDKAIETFQPGDRVLTRDGRSVPVVWVARQAVSNPRAVELGRCPVRIEAGALGPGLPGAPLTVTGDHALLFGDLLINAGALVNGTSIRLVPLAEMPTKFTWWHLELEEHEAVMANGVAAESFVDYNGRSGFDNYGEYLDLAGSDRHIVEMPLARISSQRLLPAELCELLGIAMTSTGPVADGGPGKPNAAVSARFGPARRRLPRALGRFSGAVRLVSGAIRRVATRKAA